MDIPYSRKVVAAISFFKSKTVPYEYKSMRYKFAILAFEERVRGFHLVQGAGVWRIRFIYFWHMPLADSGTVQCVPVKPFLFGGIWVGDI